MNHVRSDFDFRDGMCVPQSDVELAGNERLF